MIVLNGKCVVSNGQCSSWMDLQPGVPQGPILRPYAKALYFFKCILIIFWII